MARPPLHARLDAPAGDAAALQAALDDAREAAVARLVASGEAAPDADDDASPRSRLTLPSSFAELLATALAAAEAAGDDGHAALLRLQYLEALPSARLAQLLTTRGRAARLFHTPAPWPRLPRFRRGLDRLWALFARHGLDASAALGAPDPAAWLARFDTVAAWYVTTYWGGFEPMFQALPHDLAAALPDPDPDLAADDDAFWAAADHRLALAMLHEVLHFSPAREALFPPYLDEALAGHFGVVLDEATAFPAPGDDHGLVGWPWFSQVGEALCRAFGEGPVLAAQAGLIPWSAALPQALLDAFDRLAWGAYRTAPRVHFHPDTTRPDRWVKLTYAAAAGRDVGALDLDALDLLPWSEVALPALPEVDATIARHAALAMALEATQIGGSWRVRRAPPVGPVTVDFDRGYVEAPPRPNGAEPAPARYALPPRPGRGRVTVPIEDLADALDRGARAD